MELFVQYNFLVSLKSFKNLKSRMKVLQIAPLLQCEPQMVTSSPLPNQWYLDSELLLRGMALYCTSLHIWDYLSLLHVQSQCWTQGDSHKIWKVEGKQWPLLFSLKVRAVSRLSFTHSVADLVVDFAGMRHPPDPQVLQCSPDLLPSALACP